MLDIEEGETMNSLKSLLLVFWVITCLGCTALLREDPADPAFLWAIGNWVGESGYGRPVSARFRVVNGNQLKGDITYQSTSGNVSQGTITSGTVGKKDGSDYIEGEIYWSTARAASNFELKLAKGTLMGLLARPGQLEYGIRSAYLTKDQGK